MGRPSMFSEALGTEICRRLMQGRSLRSVCRDDDMPDRTTVHDWIVAHEAFARQYARATEVRADEEFDRIFEIADTPVIGQKTRVDADGGVEVTEADMIEHRRLQIDARKWALARMNPKKYGEKVQIGGADDLPPIKTLDASKLSTAALRELMGAMSDEGTDPDQGGPAGD